MSEKFEAGDIVYLKSGSPPMTVYVIGLDGDGAKVGTVFFLPGGTCQTGQFPTLALTKVAARIVGGAKLGLTQLTTDYGPTRALAGVTLATPSFGGVNVVGFDSVGVPFAYDELPATKLAMNAAGTVTLGCGDQSSSLLIEPYTGEISVP